MKIFVSYTTKDAHIKKCYLYNVLSILSKYAHAYIDLIHNDSIEKQKRVEDELKNSDCVFLLESNSIQQSKWVERELLIAKEFNIPVKRINSYLSLRELETSIDWIFNEKLTNSSRGTFKKFTIFASAKNRALFESP